MMKRMITTMMVLLLAVTTNYAGSKIQTVEIKTEIKCDHCNLCGSCGKRIENALYDMKGVKRVDVDGEKMLIKVVYNSEKTDPQALRETIANNGFNADEVVADATAVTRLDACCRGEE